MTEKRFLFMIVFCIVLSYNHFSFADSAVLNPDQKIEEKSAKSITDSSKADIAAILKKGPEELTKQDCLVGVKYFEEQAKLSSSSAETYTYLGFFYYMLGRYEDALFQLNQAIKLAPNSVGPYVFLGVVYKGLNRESEAHEAYLKFISISMSLANNTEEQWRLWLLRKIIE